MRLLLPLLVVGLTLPAGAQDRHGPSPAPGAVAAPAAPESDPRVLALTGAISAERLRATIERLVAFGTRNTLSDATSPARGIGAAREWLASELRHASPRLQIRVETARLAAQGRIVRETELRNVIATLPGRTARRIYVTAHYDSLNLGGQNVVASTRTPGERRVDPLLDPKQDFDVPAPGANDNGSGVALTLELARVLANSGLEFDATLVFALWAGEEQGLFGSRVHAAQIAKDGVPVTAVINNDIVGNSRGGDGRLDSTSVRVFADGAEDSASRALARFVAGVAAQYVPAHRVRLLPRPDRFDRGSDHMAFAQEGYPAIVFREATENFTRQHSADDTLDGVDVAYLAQNARVNVVAAAALALAPPRPVVTNDGGAALIARRPSGYDAALAWQASSGAVAYRVYWRDAGSHDWQHSQRVGNATEYVIPGLSIDDHVFGVAAIGPGGHESPISAYVIRPRRDAPVRLLP
jgi:hypothetical protein